MVSLTMLSSMKQELANQQAQKSRQLEDRRQATARINELDQKLAQARVGCSSGTIADGLAKPRASQKGHQLCRN